MSNGRATGRTFRAVLQALLFASKGERVEVICLTPQARTEAVRLAKEISQGYSKGHTVDSLVFQSGGSVKFVYNEKHLGLNIDKVITDDSAV